MKILQPSRKIFWGIILLLSAVLPWLSFWQSIILARRMGIDFAASASWMGLLVVLFVLGFISLLAWTLTWSRYRERILFMMESVERFPNRIRWVGWIFLFISIIGYTTIFTTPFVGTLFGSEGWIRFLVFWYFSLIGLAGIKIVRHESLWFTSLLIVVLFQTVFHLLAVNFSYVTNYPFAMGWSETSRYYYPSLFLSKFVYGQDNPWPILHPTLHLLLAPPYVVSAPLWAHRLWQVTIRFILVGAIVPALMKRLSIQDKVVRWLVSLGILLYLFEGPIYFHLAVPVIIVLLGFSLHKDRRIWFTIFIASAWCGWSRFNWYPVPGVIAAVLYFLETPVNGMSIWKYLLRPAAWIFAGTLTAFVSQRFYVSISNLPPEYFYTSFSSALLWYRLLPNATYSFGILPAAILYSLPLWILAAMKMYAIKNSFHPIRTFLLMAAFVAVFMVGIIVSLKIGGGADLHNMDAYFILLLIVSLYFVFAKYIPETVIQSQPLQLHWFMVVALIIMPVWTQLNLNTRIKLYDTNRTRAVLSALQERVDQVNAGGGEILFISQRHLISMKMLHNVSLVHEYEREDLMEMAMGGNVEYLKQFRSDMENQRFTVIVVDPLNFSIYSRKRAFSEENNVWVTQVMKYILCNYRADAIFPEDEIALYVPQEGERQCP